MHLAMRWRMNCWMSISPEFRLSDSLTHCICWTLFPRDSRRDRRRLRVVVVIISMYSQGGREQCDVKFNVGLVRMGLWLHELWCFQISTFPIGWISSSSPFFAHSIILASKQTSGILNPKSTSTKPSMNFTTFPQQHLHPPRTSKPSPENRPTLEKFLPARTPGFNGIIALVRFCIRGCYLSTTTTTTRLQFNIIHFPSSSLLFIFHHTPFFLCDFIHAFGWRNIQIYLHMYKAKSTNNQNRVSVMITSIFQDALATFQKYRMKFLLIIERVAAWACLTLPHLIRCM